MIEKIAWSDKAQWLRIRGRDVTASQVGALFGEHEFTSYYELWALKTGRLQRDPGETPPMQRGRLLEPVAVQLLRERYPAWRITHNADATKGKLSFYFRDPEHRLGGTPDVIAEAPERGGLGVVQIKSVEASVYRQKWLDENGNPEAPLWIALQATLEAYLTGATWAMVTPLIVGHGLDMPEIPVPLVPGVVDAMKAKAGEFWRMIAEGREPEPDYQRDGPAIDAIYERADEGHEVDLSGDNRIQAIIAERHAAKGIVAQYSALVDSLDAEVKAKMGEAHIAHLGQGRRITWKEVKRAGHFVPPSSSRVLRYPQPAQGRTEN